MSLNEREIQKLLVAHIQQDSRLPMKVESAEYVIRRLSPVILRLVRDAVAEDRRARREVQL